MYIQKYLRLNGRREYFLVFSQQGHYMLVIILVPCPNGFSYKMKTEKLYSVLLTYTQLPYHMLVNSLSNKYILIHVINYCILFKLVNIFLF